ncbi:hypothetical protein SRHO_G00147170 [Serrasalmus rhombeus]
MNVPSRKCLPQQTCMQALQPPTFATVDQLKLLVEKVEKLQASVDALAHKVSTRDDLPGSEARREQQRGRKRTEATVMSSEVYKQLNLGNRPESKRASLCSAETGKTMGVVDGYKVTLKIGSKDDRHQGRFSAVTHRIDTGNAQPVRQATRRTPLGFQAEEAEHLQEMLSSGVVVPCTSEWASPVVLVRKKDGGVRWCIDYQKLNDLTLKDAYPLPNIEECLDTLEGATVFSTLDLQKSGYWQVEVRKQERCKTTFITKYGLFEYTRMPFGALFRGPWRLNFGDYNGRTSLSTSMM